MFLLLPVLLLANRKSQSIVEGKENFEEFEHASGTDSIAHESEATIPWTKQLLPYSGYVNSVSFWNTLVRPFYLLASPAVLWATLLFTICISWLVAISLTLSQIFSAPPYNFSVGAVGATNMASFVASVLGTIVAGPLIDGVATRMSKMNSGIFGSCSTSFHNLYVD
jgi:hypothetical protein